MIKTWQALVGDIASTTYQGYVTKEEIDACKQAEIDELRAALKERDAKHLAGLEAIAMHVEALESKVAAQRVVLEQAREALSYIRTRVEDGWNTTTQDRLREAAITAIQGVLK